MSTKSSSERPSTPVTIIALSVQTGSHNANPASPIASSKPSPTSGSSDSVTTTTTSSTVLDDILDDKQPKIQKLSTLRLITAHIGAALALFLATTDATIVSTSLPTITSQFKASQNQYTWVGVAYMLTQTAFQPLYGRISDLVGRKTILYSSMAVFAIGSLLCGAAQSINWLIAARALAGVGGGGIVSAVWILTAEIVEVQNRAKWSQALSVTWCCSAVAGPLLGGIFSGSSNWRWGFYINLPICLVALLVLLLSLRGVHAVQPTDASWDALLKKFDFLGLILFMAGTSCLVVGFSFANEAGWSAPSTLILICLGFVVLVCAGIYERYTTRECLFPPTMFNDVTTVVVLAINFLHNFAFTSGTFYLALFYQAANGSTPLEAGLKLLPYSLGSSLASMPAAWFIGYWQKRTNSTSGQKCIISAGLLISTIGFGILTLMNENAPVAIQVIFPLITGVGLGMLFHAPYQIFTRALKPKELASGTSAFFLVRFTGATIGLAVAGLTFFARVTSRLPPEVIPDSSLSSIDYSSLHDLEPLMLRTHVLRVISSSIQTVWAVCTPCLGVAFLITFLLRDMPVHSDILKDHSVSHSQTSQTMIEKTDGEKVEV